MGVSMCIELTACETLNNENDIQMSTDPTVEKVRALKLYRYESSNTGVGEQ